MRLHVCRRDLCVLPRRRCPAAHPKRLRRYARPFCHYSMLIGSLLHLRSIDGVRCGVVRSDGGSEYCRVLWPVQCWLCLPVQFHVGDSRRVHERRHVVSHRFRRTHCRTGRIFSQRGTQPAQRMRRWLLLLVWRREPVRRGVLWRDDGAVGSELQRRLRRGVYLPPRKPQRDRRSVPWRRIRVSARVVSSNHAGCGLLSERRPLDSAAVRAWGLVLRRHQHGLCAGPLRVVASSEQRCVHGRL